MKKPSPKGKTTRTSEGTEKRGRDGEKSGEDDATKNGETEAKTQYPTSFRLSPIAKELLRLIAEDTGSNLNKTVELAIRDLAKARGISIPRKK